MTVQNRIVIAAAGSGKTTYLVEEALKVKGERVLITTYTESNEAEIRQKFFELVGHVPANVVIMTWFKFLIRHGVKPFHGRIFDFPVGGLLFVSGRSGIKYRNSRGQDVPWPESEFERHYFDTSRRIYSDKLSKLAIRCDKASGGAVIDRISRVFRHVFVDEVQDLAGCDLDILALLTRSPARLLMVGDPRQVTYLTHHESRHTKYVDGGIVDFLREQLPKKVAIEIDETTLSSSHRNTHYLETVRPMQLRENIRSLGVDHRSPVMNIGMSKGLGFDHVIVLPTKPMQVWLIDPASELKSQSRAKFYVALTRARYSVAIAMEWGDAPLPAGFSIYDRTLAG